jgi:hypothetical protein
MAGDLSQAPETISSTAPVGHPEASFWPWAKTGSYLPQAGNELQILIDGEAAYGEIAAAFHAAGKFGMQDFLLVPVSGEQTFDILRSRRKEGVDVRAVIWQPASFTYNTIPDLAPKCIPGRHSHGDQSRRLRPTRGRRPHRGRGQDRLPELPHEWPLQPPDEDGRTDR